MTWEYWICRKRPAEHGWARAAGWVGAREGRASFGDRRRERSARFGPGAAERIRSLRPGRRRPGRQVGFQRWGSRGSSSSSLAPGKIAGRRVSTSRR